VIPLLRKNLKKNIRILNEAFRARVIKVSNIAGSSVSLEVLQPTHTSWPEGHLVTQLGALPFYPLGTGGIL